MGCEVSNPSEILISHKNEELSGTAIASTLEGMRPLMIETSTRKHCSVRNSTTQYDWLQCQKAQYDSGRIRKRAGFRLGAKDVFLNITGGISVDDPAIDLAVVAAILSSNEDIAVKIFVLLAKWDFQVKFVPNRVDQAFRKQKN
jgi:DNA repair protein RadA/Sms